MNNSRATVKLMVRGFALLSGCVTHLELLDLILEPFRFGVCFGDLLRQRRHITVRGSSKIPSSLFAFFQCRRNWTSRLPAAGFGMARRHWQKRRKRRWREEFFRSSELNPLSNSRYSSGVWHSLAFGRKSRPASFFVVNLLVKDFI